MLARPNPETDEYPYPESAMAAFSSPQDVTIQLTTGGQPHIGAERIFINTGSQPAIPPIEGVESEKVFTSASLIAEAKSESRGKGYEVKVFNIPASAIPKAAILNERRGLLKAVVDAKTHRILGRTLFCAEAQEMINTIQLAIHTDVAYDTLANMVFTHPSMNEALNELFANG